MEKKVQDYFNREYPIEILKDSDGAYLVRIPDLLGCVDEGQTLEEAIKNIEQAKREWIEEAIEDGREIPEPSEDVEHSGHILLRMSKSLHATLVRMAKHEGISLNQFINQTLCMNLGLRILEEYEQRLGNISWKIKAEVVHHHVWHGLSERTMATPKDDLSSHETKIPRLKKDMFYLVESMAS